MTGTANGHHRTPETGTVFDAVIVGAGFAGMYMLHRLRGLGFNARVYEAGGGVGGTWYWNRYPGARCDVESMQYSFSFSEELDQQWNWSEKYAPQPEILSYANHVADRFDLRRHILFDTRVTSATFDETEKCWRIETDRGDKVSAKFCIMAVGCLSAANHVPFKGREDFRGPIYHTGEWPHERRGLHRASRRRHRHRLVGDPVDPDHRATGLSSSPCSSAPRPIRCRPGTPG